MPVPDGWIEAESKRTWWLVIDGITQLSVVKCDAGWMSSVIDAGTHATAEDAMAVAGVLYKMGG